MSTIDRDELDIKDPPIFVYADYGRRKTKVEKKHQCGVTQCPVCQEDVDIRTHKCFIQPAEEEE